MTRIISPVEDVNEENHRVWAAHISLSASAAAAILRLAEICRREDLYCVQRFDATADFLSGAYPKPDESVDQLLARCRTSVDLSMCVVEKDCFSYQAVSKGSDADPGFRTAHIPLSVLEAGEDAVVVVSSDDGAGTVLEALTVQAFEEFDII